MNDSFLLPFQAAGIALIIFGLAQLAVAAITGRFSKRKGAEPRPMSVVRLSAGGLVLPDCQVCGATTLTAKPDKFVALLEGKEPNNWNCPVCGVDLKDELLTSDVAAEIGRRLAKLEAAKPYPGMT